MTFRFAFDDQGGFIVDDGEVTVYAHPSSPRAQDAKRAPQNTARKMLAREHIFRGTATAAAEPYRTMIADFDARQRAKLDAILG